MIRITKPIDIQNTFHFGPANVIFVPAQCVKTRKHPIYRHILMSL